VSTQLFIRDSGAGTALAVLASVVLIIVSCSGLGGRLDLRRGVPGQGVTPRPSAAELATLAPPANVSPALWAELKDALAKATATAPVTNAAQVRDLAALPQPDDSLVLEWTYTNPGDYDQNAVVGLPDLVVLAAHFGERSGSPGWPAAECADGNGDGVISLADVTPIGQDFGASVDGYSVQSSAMAGEEGYGDVGQAPLANATAPTGGGRLRFSFEVENPPYPRYWRVRPYESSTQGNQTAISQGTASLPVPLGIGGSGWTTQGANAQRNGRLNSPGPRELHMAWSLHAPPGSSYTYADPEPVFGPDGTIYILAPSELDAFQASGGNIRSTLYAGGDGGSAAVGPDGMVYAPSRQGLVALTADLTLLWTYYMDSTVVGSPIVAADGSIVFTCEDDSVRALHPDGSLKWTCALTGLYLSPVAERPTGGFVLAGDFDRVFSLAAVSEAGASEWKFPLPFDHPRDSSVVVAVGNDGTAFVNGERGLAAVSSDGQLLWEYDPGYLEESVSPAAIGPDGAVFLLVQDPVDSSEDLVALNTDGSVRQKTTLEGPQGTYLKPPITDSDGWVYVLGLGLPPEVAQVVQVFSPTLAPAFTFSLPEEDYGTMSLCAGGRLCISCPEADRLVLLTAGAPLQPPQAPQGVSASDGGSEYDITISWADASGATGYEVYRDTQNAPVATVGVTPSFVDTAAIGGAVHTYWVRALNEAGASPFSESDTGYAQLPAPTGLVASDGTYADHIELTWDAVRAADTYEVYRDNSDVPLATLGVATTYSDYSLTDWDEHDYLLRARAGGNLSERSAKATGALTRGAGDPGRGDWYMPGHDPAHTRRSPFIGPSNPAVLWEYVWSYGFEAIVGSSGRAYYSTSSELQAIDPGGILRFSLKGAGSCVVGPDGALIAPGRDYPDYGLFCYNPNGTLRWSVLPDQVFDVAQVTSGTIYTAGPNGIAAYSTDGALLWQYAVWGGLSSDPSLTVSPGGTLYLIGPTDDQDPPQRVVYALNSAGQIIWARPYPLSSTCTALGAPDGTLYVVSGSEVHAIASDGSESWVFTCADYIMGHAALATTGVVYVASWDNLLHALNPDGSEFRSITLPGHPTATPAVDGLERVYIVCSTTPAPKLLAFDSGGNPVWSLDLPAVMDPLGTISIADDGTLLVSAYKGLIAVGESS